MEFKLKNFGQKKKKYLFYFSFILEKSIEEKNKMEKLEKQIIEEYQNGKSISKLLADFPMTNRRTITKILTSNGITIRGGRKKKELSEEQILEIKNMINNGAFLIEIAKHFNLDKETMRLRLKELGLEITNKNRVNRQIKSDYFSKIDTHEKAYWLGFLFTDGSVDHYKTSGRIRLQLQERDKEILEKFRQDLGIESKIIYDVRPNSTCCSVEFVDEQIYQDLNKYDIIQNKTYKISHIPYEKIPEEFLASYALGLFDGDGGLSYSKDFSKDVTLSYTAYHEQEVKDFQLIINKLANIKIFNKHFFTSAWHVQWRGRLQVLKILDVLYDKCPRHLARKYDKYLALKNSLN